MMIKESFIKMVVRLSEEFSIPDIADLFLPVFCKGGQPRDAEFMAVKLSSGAVGISYVLLPDEIINDYENIRQHTFAGRSPAVYAQGFGHEDPIKNMLGLAAVNAICQHVMATAAYPLDAAADSLGMLDIQDNDRVGMVGFFPPLVKAINECSAELIVIEKNKKFIDNFPELNISLDPGKLKTCNKVLCTSTTVLNDTLNEILDNCSADATISIVGPTAGYFPDPLFERGVDVVGGTFVKNGDLFFELLKNGERWGPATQKFCFHKESYQGIPDANSINQ